MSSAANCCSVCEKPIKPEGVDGPDHVFYFCEKVADLKSVPKKQPTLAEQMEISLKLIRNNMPQMLEITAINAKLKREYFKSLVKEGFTENQALSITVETSSTGGYL